jgi:hypothetical protein
MASRKILKPRDKSYFKLKATTKGAQRMETFSLNKLAEQFECDRGTLVKAMRRVRPDLEITKGRPLWKIATAAKALRAHHQKTNDGSNPTGGVSSTGSLTAERSRLARAQAIKVEHEKKIAHRTTGYTAMSSRGLRRS